MLEPYIDDTNIESPNRTNRPNRSEYLIDNWNLTNRWKAKQELDTTSSSPAKYASYEAWSSSLDSRLQAQEESYAIDQAFERAQRDQWLQEIEKTDLKLEKQGETAASLLVDDSREAVISAADELCVASVNLENAMGSHEAKDYVMEEASCDCEMSFQQLDRNQDGVIDRQEWDTGSLRQRLFDRKQLAARDEASRWAAVTPDEAVAIRQHAVQLAMRNRASY
jgi:hypothetical protein